MKRFVIALVALAFAAIPGVANAQTPGGQFLVRCNYSHSAQVDPIVSPGVFPSAHLHDFYGNTTTDQFSTLDSMLGQPTTCASPEDTAGYWIPQPMLDGVPFHALQSHSYYFQTPFLNQTITPFPPGMEMIAGNSHATSPSQLDPHILFSCGQNPPYLRSPEVNHPYDCTPYKGIRGEDGVVIVIKFPECWDGTGTAPTDMVYAVSSSCPAGFPVKMPDLQQRYHLGIYNPLYPDGSVALSFSSGPWYTIHADYFQTWNQAKLDQLVADCLSAGIHCGGIKT